MKYCYYCTDEITEYENHYSEDQSDGKKRYIHEDDCLDNYILSETKEDYLEGMKHHKGDF